MKLLNLDRYKAFVDHVKQSFSTNADPLIPWSTYVVAEKLNLTCTVRTQAFYKGSDAQNVL